MFALWLSEERPSRDAASRLPRSVSLEAGYFPCPIVPPVRLDPPERAPLAHEEAGGSRWINEIGKRRLLSLSLFEKNWKKNWNGVTFWVKISLVLSVICEPNGWDGPKGYAKQKLQRLTPFQVLQVFYDIGISFILGLFFLWKPGAVLKNISDEEKRLKNVKRLRVVGIVLVVISAIRLFGVLAGFDQRYNL